MQSILTMMSHKNDSPQYLSESALALSI